MELLQALGLNVKILIAQLVNFAILFYVLYKFGYNPMLKFLDERSKKIEKGISDAELAGEKLLEITEKEKEVLKNAKKEALQIVEEAKASAEKKKEEIIKKAKNEIGEVINAEKAKMQAEKAQTLKEIKEDVAKLVMMSVEKVLEEKMDSKKDADLVKKIVKDLK